MTTKKLNTLTNTELLDELIKMQSGCERYSKYFKKEAQCIELNASGQKYLAQLREEILKRMQSNKGTEAFKLYGIRDKETGKLKSNLVNPRRKYWDREAYAKDALCRNHYTGYDGHELELVTIHCFVDDENKEEN